MDEPIQGVSSAAAWRGGWDLAETWDLGSPYQEKWITCPTFFVGIGFPAKQAQLENSCCYISPGFQDTFKLGGFTVYTSTLLCSVFPTARQVGSSRRSTGLPFVLLTSAVSLHCIGFTSAVVFHFVWLFTLYCRVTGSIAAWFAHDFSSTIALRDHRTWEGCFLGGENRNWE